MRIAIVGHGFVGRAVDKGFPTAAEDKFLVDPRYGTTIEQLAAFSPDLVFVCVPASMTEYGTDFTNLRDALERLGTVVPATVVAVKSTVTPDILVVLDGLHPRLVYNPEFLTEANADHDFLNPPMLVLGGKQRDVAIVEAAFRTVSLCNPAPVYRVDLKTASLVKYAINSFLATKVTFFNELRAVFDAVGAESSWDLFTRAVTSDPRIGSTHVTVPGPDGRYGWSGSCLPRDTVALAQMARRTDAPMRVLETAIEENARTRSQYPLTPREAEAGIRFDIDVDGGLRPQLSPA